jgi:uridylate kinase
MGGTHPGHTTDAVTVFMGEKLRADRVIITTNVAGVFTADPNKDKSATLIERLTPEKLVEIVGTMAHEAGSKGVIDPLGAKLVARSKIITYVLDGRDLKNLDAAIEGRKFRGSVIAS